MLMHTPLYAAVHELFRPLRYRHLSSRIGSHKALTAVARAGWLHLGRRPIAGGAASGCMKRGVNGASRGRGWQRLPRTLVPSYVVPTHAPSPKDTSVTTHCHAATAQLTRDYQSDHRCYVLTPATTCAVHPICAGPP
jgi:hypothetical protein